MANTVDEDPTSLDDVAIVQSFVTPGPFSSNDLFIMMPFNSSIHGDSVRLRECKTCFCLIGDVENHYKAVHPDFDISPYYTDYIYKATRRFAWYGDYEDNSEFVWFLFGEVSK